MVDVNYGFVCFELELAHGGRLNAKGIGFDSVRPPEVPFQLPPFYAVISLRFGPGEFGTHEISISIVDIDSNAISNPFDEPFTVEPPQPPHFYRNNRIYTRVETLVFPDYGDYVFNWLLDGHEIHRANITVSRPTASA